MTTHVPPAPRPLCAAFAPLLPLISSGALADDEAVPTREHVAGCAWCQQELARYKAVDEALRREFGASAQENMLPFPLELDGGEGYAEEYAFTLEDTLEETMTEGHDQRDSKPSTATRSSRWEKRRRSLSPRATAIASIAAALILAVVATTIYTQFASRRSTSAAATTAPTGALSKFMTLPNPSVNIGELTAGSDGSLWFIEGASRHDKIGHITMDGKLTEYPLESADRASGTDVGINMTLGPDGNLWFAFSNFFSGSNASAGLTSQTAIMRVSPIGKITTFNALPPNVSAYSLRFGPDGALWFTEGMKIGRLAMDGQLTEYPLPAPGKNGVTGLCFGSDGALWYVWLLEKRVGRMTLSGEFQEFPIPNANVGDIVSGADGALWFPEADPASQDGRTLTRKGVIGRITTAGVFNEVAIGPSLVVAQIVAGSAGAIWFSALDQGGSTLKLGRVMSSGEVKIYATNETSVAGGEIAATPGAIWLLDGHNTLWRYRLPA